MRPVVKPWPTDNKGNLKKYSPFDTAKSDLFLVIGQYCSYCETWGYSASVAVEHVQPKKYQLPDGSSPYAHLEENWDNFLLGCVNCNSVKLNKDVKLTDVCLPHLHNSSMAFIYKEGGYIKINDSLSVAEKAMAENMLQLTGLDRRPGTPNYSRKDKRWDQRRDCWELAIRYLNKLQNKETDVNTITDLAKAKGHWSVWMSVFENHPVIRQALIEAFPGTAANCFDQHTVPLRRNGTII
jgi:uncharacterized protein (TIGR02646 family)